eukprot:gene37124-60365_t
MIAGDGSTMKLKGCGLVVINPPWQFDREAEPMLGFLGEALAQARGGGGRVTWLVGERGLGGSESAGTLRGTQSVATGPHTVADDRAMPEGSPYYQLVAGELIKAPSPSIFHQEVVGNIYLLLANHVRKHRLGKVRIASLDVYLSETSVVQPDVFFLANASLPLIQSDGVHGAPDLVIEI